MDPHSDPIILESARRHGVADADMLHAYRNAFRTELQENGTMFLGADRAGRLLEVLVALGPDGPRIFHAMPARRRFFA